MPYEGITQNYPEPNLVRENIRKNVTVFGVPGNYEGGIGVGANKSYLVPSLQQYLVSNLTPTLDTYKSGGTVYLGNLFLFRAYQHSSGNQYVHCMYYDGTNWIANPTTNNLGRPVGYLNPTTTNIKVNGNLVEITWENGPSNRVHEIFNMDTKTWSQSPGVGSGSPMPLSVTHEGITYTPSGDMILSVQGYSFKAFLPSFKLS